MIVQTAEASSPHFVIRMAEHTELAGRMARAFGNKAFEPVASELQYVIANHDAGWEDLDSRFVIDPDTGLPYNLTETPFELILKTSRGSPDFNEKHHPFSGLLSSMHSWGLYNGRYGLSDIVLLDSIAAQNRDAAQGMLDHEETRQMRLKDELRGHPDTAGWIADDSLMKSYKQLQFFDTLALYFNRVHEGARQTAVFPHVPQSGAEDTDVTVTPLGGGHLPRRPVPLRR